LGISHTEEIWVADFHRIPKLTGYPQEELIKPVTEFICGEAVALELEQERPGMRPKLGFVIDRQCVVLEELRVEEPWIPLSGLRSIARMRRIDRNREFLPHLEAHLKGFWYLTEVVVEAVDGRWSVEARIVAHSPKESFALVLVLAILGEALPGERALGILPVIDLALPTFASPGGRTEAD